MRFPFCRKRKRQRFRLAMRPLKWRNFVAFLFLIDGLLAIANTTNYPVIPIASQNCDNVTNGGSISGNETGCPSPNWNPGLIGNVTLPTGGNGELEYVWMYTNSDPLLPLTMWIPIPNSNSPVYDPEPIIQTTHYKRFSKRAGCETFTGESNYVTKEAVCCRNVTGGGLIGNNQTNCISPFDPNEITSLYLPGGGAGNLLFQWIYSETETQYTPENQEWKVIPGAITASYDPGPVTKTTWFIRLARRSGCTEFEGVSNMVKIAIESPVKITGVSIKNVTCHGGNDGAISLVYEGAQFPVNFNWSPTLGNVKDPANIRSGNYSVTLSDALGCIATKSVVVQDGEKLTLGVSAVPETCLGSKDAAASITWVTGGTPGYAYSWSTGEGNVTSLKNLVPGVYSVTATDAKGCKGSGQVQVSSGKPLDIQLDIKAESCLGAGNGEAKVSGVVGGTPVYNYNWSNAPLNNTLSISGLKPDDYTITVTDSRGCFGEKAFTVPKGNPLSVNVASSPVKCNGTNTGSAEVISVQNAIYPVIYKWDDPMKSDNSSLDGLIAGSYKVLVKDQLGCTGSAIVSVPEPFALNLMTSSKAPGCSNTQDGSATVQVNGGIAPYRYMWSNQQTAPTSLGLGPGTVLVTVTDVNGCIAVSSVDIPAAPEMKIGFESKDVSCYGGNDGYIKLNVEAGEAASLVYSWGNGILSNTNVASGLKAGFYAVTVSNTIGCSTATSIIISNPPPLKVDLTARRASCFENEDGTVIAQARGGTPYEGNSYSYVWNAPGSPTGPTLGNVPGGTYAVLASDAKGCVATAKIDVDSPTPITAELSISRVTCKGASDGRIEIAVNGGIAPYQYKWNQEVSSTSNVLSNLKTGIYRVTITDDNGCIRIEEAIVAEPEALNITLGKADPLCESSANGAIISRTIGGSAPFLYSWSNGKTSTNISDLLPGNYTLTVTDGNGCQASSSMVLTAKSDFTATVSASNASCSGISDGTASVTVSGGSQPYNFKWSNGAVSPVVSGLAAGTYSVRVDDAAGCYSEQFVVVDYGRNTICSSSVINDIGKYGSNDGKAVASASGVSGTVSYVWSNGSQSAVNEGLSAGTYQVTITDAKGCSCSSQIILKNPSKIGRMVWNDLNQNGIRESDEPGLAGILVILKGTTRSGIVVDLETVSNPDGTYAFDGLSAGLYQLEFKLPVSAFFSPRLKGGTSTDSDADPFTGLTEKFELPENTYADNYDAGIIMLDEWTNIGDYVWEDANRNGMQEIDENGIPNVIVNLLSMPSGKIIATTATDKIGKYQFNRVPAGKYQLEFMTSGLSKLYSFSPARYGSDILKDSDVDPSNGKIQDVVVTPYSLDNMSMDAGLYLTCDNVKTGGRISGNETFCDNIAKPDLIQSLSPASGGQGTIQYQWYYSNSPGFQGIGDTDWKPLDSTFFPELSLESLKESRFYIRLAKRSGCNDFGAFSNVVSKIIDPLPLAQIKEFGSELCLGEKYKIEAINAGSGTSYTWDFDNSSVSSTSAEGRTAEVAWSTGGFKTITLTVKRFGCIQVFTQTVFIRKCEPPMSFSEFKAQAAGDRVLLTWKMNNGNDNVIYFMQRSEDGLTFENLGAISGSQHDGSGTFTYTDHRPLFGDNYYRILFKRNQDSGFSSIEQLYLSGTGISQIHLFPNPSSGPVTIEILKRSQEPGFFEVCNLYGKVLMRVEIPAKATKIQHDLSNFKAGVYLIKVKQKGMREMTRKLVISD